MAHSGLLVSLCDVVERRRSYISEVEAWAVLCQAAQALQDLFLNGGEVEKRGTLGNVQLTPKGRVLLGHRPWSVQPTSPLSDTQLEKMWIYSLGMTVKGVVNLSLASHALRSTLESMTIPDIKSRASLMDVLDIITAYCRQRQQSKPLSHVIMDMYCNAVMPPEQVTSPQRSKATWSPSAHCKAEEKTRSPPSENGGLEVGSRLYRVPEGGAKYCGPTTLIGPEFIIRASEPPLTLTLGSPKSSSRRKVLVVLLNGQKLEVTCDPSLTTFADIFQVAVGKEAGDFVVTLGLASLLSGDFVVPPLDLKLSKVAPSHWLHSRVKPTSQCPPFTLYVRFRLFLPSLRGTRSWKWKHLLYLQLRRSILERQIRGEKHQLMALAGLALQAELGDFNPQNEGRDYFALDDYLPNIDVGKSELVYLHKQRSGLDPGRAEEMFISHTMTLQEYGSHFISAKIVCQVGKEENLRDVWVCVNSQGVSLPEMDREGCHGVRETNLKFPWPDIRKLSYTKHFFEVITSDNKFKLKLEDNKSLFLFHMCWLHHKFFMKLTNQYASLQSLAEEFGPKSSSKGKNVLSVSGGGSRAPELSALRRAASLLSPDRAIFRGKTSTHCGRSSRSESCRESKSPITSLISPSDSSISTLSSPKSSVVDNDCVPGKGARRRVLMGTRAIYTNSQLDLRPSVHLDIPTPPSPLPEVYLLNSSIKSINDKYHVDFQETLSESLAEKFDKISVANDRILTTARLKRSEEGSLGLEVVEGKDGGAYIISAIPGGPAALSGVVHTGDQIQAVNGQNVLGIQYNKVLRLVESSGQSVELLLSQLNLGQATNSPKAPFEKDHNQGCDLLGDILQKPIEESYLNSIRYQMANESDHHMMITDLPRPLSYL